MAREKSVSVPVASRRAAWATSSIAWPIIPGKISPTEIVSSATATKMSSRAAIHSGCPVWTLRIAKKYPTPSRVSTRSMDPVNLVWSDQAYFRMFRPRRSCQQRTA